MIGIQNFQRLSLLQIRIDFTLYSIDERQSWNEYTEQFKIQEGVTKLLFRSQTLGGDMEQERHAALGLTLKEKYKENKGSRSKFSTSD